MRHGVLAGAGGVPPGVLVVGPPGVVAGVCGFVLVSSEQPEIQIPKPVNTTPIIVALIIFRMNVASDLGNAAVSDLA